MKKWIDGRETSSTLPFFSLRRKGKNIALISVLYWCVLSCLYRVFTHSIRKEHRSSWKLLPEMISRNWLRVDMNWSRWLYRKIKEFGGEFSIKGRLWDIITTQLVGATNVIVLKIASQYGKITWRRQFREPGLSLEGAHGISGPYDGVLIESWNKE